MSITLSRHDEHLVRTAAYGAVALLAAATGSPLSARSIAALTSATGVVGQVLATPATEFEPQGQDTADRVLPALTAAATLLGAQAPDEADNFRRTVLLALEGFPAAPDLPAVREITAALDAAQVAEDRPELRQAIEEIVESGFVGVSLRVRDERGEWNSSAGTAELGGTAKPAADAHVRIGSNTKTFTATLVLQLVAEGRVELDAPVAGYLPEFGVDERITVRMLLQHTSGLFNFTGEVNADGAVALGIPMPYGPRGEEWLDSRFTAYQPRELVELALSRPARFEPGTGWSYSNTNYVLARLLIEKITGRSAAEETMLRIAEPLKLSGTLLPDGPEIPEPHAHAYYRHEVSGEQQTVDITRQDPSWVSAGGDMISTTEDLAVFISALLGGKLLPPELVAEMCAPHPTGIPNMDYGLGVFVLTTENGGTVISHNGAQGGHAALMYSTPDGSKTLTAALNCVDDAGMSIAAAFQSVQHKLLREVF